MYPGELLAHAHLLGLDPQELPAPLDGMARRGRVSLYNTHITLVLCYLVTDSAKQVFYLMAVPLGVKEGKGRQLSKKVIF